MTKSFGRRRTRAGYGGAGFPGVLGRAVAAALGDPGGTLDHLTIDLVDTDFSKSSRT